MGLIETIVRRKVLVSMLFIGTCLLGVISYRNLPLEIMPDVDLPFLIVRVSSRYEVNPEYLERKGVVPLEGAAGSMAGLNKLESRIDQRSGTIFAYFDRGVDMNLAYLDLQERVEALTSSLPEEFQVSVLKVDTERLSNMFMRLQVRGSGGLERLRALIDEKIQREFSSIEGVANVDVTGGRSETVEISLAPEAAEAYNMSPGRVRSLIAAGNLDKTFVGRAYDGDRVYFVNLQSDYDKVLKLEQLVVDAKGPVLLGDIADITFGLKDQTTVSRVNGKDAITLQLVRDANVNLIALSRAVRAKVDELNRSLASQDVQIVIQSDTGEDMQKNLDLILNLALTGGLLSVLILWFFMRNLRLVTVVLLAIPVSILTAFNFFYGYHISLNSLTLVGMALAVGMLLDNSVVVLENIYRLVSLGKGRDIAVTQGTREVWRSIVASTLTTITVFLPFVFADDFMIRLIGRNVGVSIVSTLLVSLVVALLLVPMLAHALLDRKTKPISFNRVSQKNRAVQIYTLLLKTGMRYPVPTILGTALVFFASIVICMGLSLDVPRQAEQSELTVYLTMPRGATLETTDLAASKLESRLDSIPEVQDRVTTVYEDEATVTLQFKKDYEKTFHRDIQAIRSEVGRRIDNFGTGDVSLTEPSSSTRFSGGMGGGQMASFERLFGIGNQQEKVVIMGNDFDLLRKVADDVQYVLEHNESISRARQNMSGSRPEVHVLLDHRLLSYYSIPLTSVTTELASFQKEVTSGTMFKQGDIEYDIVIRTDEPEKERTFRDLEDLRISTSAGGEFYLSQLSRIVFASDLSQITRLNQENRVEVSYSFRDEITDSKSLLQASRDGIDQLMASMTLPPGVALQVEHEENQYKDFYFLIAAAFILIYMILASTFESLTAPPVILFTIPLATIGAFWGLILTGNSLNNANSMVGFLILLGVVVNNGIILIDYTKILRSRGFRRSRALMTAGQARLRPILITAATTIVGMLPLAMGKAEYVTQVGAPFAITVIGGLSLSTLFTLVFIPTVYSGLESMLAWLRTLSLRLKIGQALVFAGLCALIWWGVDSLLWRGVWLFLAATAVPGVTWFTLSSLRQAREDVIERGTSLTIGIRRLVKVYDSYGRFVREWKKAERMEQLRGPIRVYRSWRDLDSLQWQLPIFGFGVYYVFFYLQSHFWIVVLSVVLQVFLLSGLKPVRAWLDYRAGSRGGAQEGSKFARRLALVLFWLPPALCLGSYHQMGFKLPGIIFVATLWYAGLAVKAASDRLYGQKINIMRLSGHLVWLRMNFYRLVRMVPVIGRKRTPFKALDSVSLEIESGMFGLLGPNGAGKTTLMRVVCGVLDQSYGTVRINGISYDEKREELQGLIGYLPQEFGTYDNMSAREFLDYIAILKRIYDSEERLKRVDYVLGAVHLTEQAERRIGSFSGGMKQRIGIAMTLLHLPRILVVDEPTAGLDPRERIRFRNLLVELSRERIVIFSTHIIEDISSSCNKVAVLDRGAMHYLGDPQDMTRAAQGHVWQFNLEPQEFQAARESLRIVHHMRVEDKIRVRCLSDQSPRPDAIQAQPTLEDAYLWLLGRDPESAQKKMKAKKTGAAAPKES